MMTRSIALFWCAAVLGLAEPTCAWAGQLALDDVEVANAREALVERLKAAQAAGVVVPRSAPDLEPMEGVRATRAAPASSAPIPRNSEPRAVAQDGKCLDAAQIADQRQTLGADAFAEINLIRRLAQEPHGGAADALVERLALAYLSIGFTDEAAATLAGFGPDNSLAAAIKLVAAAAGASSGGQPTETPSALCDVLGAIAAYSTAPDNARRMPVDALVIDEIAELPSPLGAAVATQLVSRLLDRRDAEGARRILALLGTMAQVDDDASISALRDRLSALEAATQDGVAVEVPVAERLTRLSLLVAHPEFIDDVGPPAATDALALLADVGAPEAIKRANLLALAPPAIGEFYLARALFRAGRLNAAREIVERRAANMQFERLRDDMALAAASSSPEPDGAGAIVAWRSGEWAAAEQALIPEFANQPHLGTARKLSIAAALAGRKSGPPAAVEFLRKDERSRDLLSWFEPVPQAATLDALLRFANSMTMEVSSMKAILNDE